MPDNLPVEANGHHPDITATDLGLNERQYRFVCEYIKDFNATAAYKRAGYRAKGRAAEVNASKLLRHAKVREALTRVRASLAERTLVDREFVMIGLREVYDRSMMAKPVFDKEGEPTGEWTFNGQVANKSLELMGKELGMFTDRVEVSGGDPIKTFTIVKHIREDQ